MRTPLLSLGLVALLVAACAGGSSTAASYAPGEPGHHRSTPAPWPEPAATPYDGTVDAHAFLDLLDSLARTED
ncbi:MAG: hypothetical protein ACXW4T_06285 [Candidatus Limnocylindrales bacterium]